MTGSIPIRTPYQGLSQIFDYNRPLYLRTVSGAIAAIFVALYAPSAVRLLITLATGTALFWICSSLVVSHYVYDRSGLYTLGWLSGCLSQPPRRWLNIHAGLDESSIVISSLFPGSEGQIIDIYDPRTMTEPSIKRARRLAGLSSRPRHAARLPDSDNDLDAVFLMFAAHELRRREHRALLFREVARVLRVGGELVLIEHLRDWPNFLAFGPGFLHFFSKRTWETAASSADLSLRLHRIVTPFVHVFVFENSHEP